MSFKTTVTPSPKNAPSPGVDTVDADKSTLSVPLLESQPSSAAVLAKSAKPAVGKKTSWRPPQWLVWVTLTATQLMFSGYHVMSEFGLKKVEPEPVTLIFVAYRQTMGSILMIVAAFLFDGRIVLPQRSDLLTFIFMGFFSFCNGAGFLVGLAMTGAPNAAILQPTIPVFTALLAIVFRFEKLNWIRIGGVVCAVGGAALVLASDMSGDDSSHSHGEMVGGNIILILQCFAMAGVYILQKKVIGRYSASSITAVSNVIAVCFMYLATMYYANRSDAWGFGAGSVWFWKTWVALAYSGVVATFFAFCLLTWANQFTVASNVAIFSALQPFGTVLMSYFFLSDDITWSQGVGGVFIVAGLFVTIYATVRQNKLKAKVEEAQKTAQTSAGGTASSLPVVVDNPPVIPVAPLATASPYAK